MRKWFWIDRNNPARSLLNGMRVSMVLIALGAALYACTASAQQTTPQPPVIIAPGAGISPMHLEPWTNGRYIIRDATGRQVGTIEPGVNNWIIRDTTGRETGRVSR